MVLQNLQEKHFLQTWGSSQQWAKACLNSKTNILLLRKWFDTLKQTKWETYIYKNDAVLTQCHSPERMEPIFSSQELSITATLQCQISLFVHLTHLCVNDHPWRIQQDPQMLVLKDATLPYTSSAQAIYSGNKAHYEEVQRCRQMKWCQYQKTFDVPSYPTLNCPTSNNTNTWVLTDLPPQFIKYLIRTH